MDLEPLRSALRSASHAAFPALEVVILFGSTARGSERPDSDIDLAVFGNVDVLALSAVLSTTLCREVDVVRIEGAPIPLLDSVLREGTLVFEGLTGASASLRSRLLASLELDRGWYERMQRAFLERVRTRGILGQ